MRGPSALAVAAMLGPPLFVASWVVSGLLRPGYNPLEQAISELAALGTTHRWMVTLGICAFGVSCLAFAALVDGPARISAAVAGATAFAIAALPCTEGCPGSGSFTDVGHGIAAGFHYAALALTPLLLSRGPGSIAAFVVGGGALLLQGLGVGPNGLMQRIGFTALDIWIVAVVSSRFWHGDPPG